MTKDYGWSRSQRIASRSKQSPRATTERACDGKSFRSQDGALGETRATCGANPLSNRPVHHRGGVRHYRAMDETTQPSARSLLQPAGGGAFDCSGSRHWATRVAVPTRGTETEGGPAAAPRFGGCFDGDDLAGVVGAFPRATAVSVPAKLPSGR